MYQHSCTKTATATAAPIIRSVGLFCEPPLAGAAGLVRGGGRGVARARARERAREPGAGLLLRARARSVAACTAFSLASRTDCAFVRAGAGLLLLFRALPRAATQLIKT